MPVLHRVPKKVRIFISRSNTIAYRGISPGDSELNDQFAEVSSQKQDSGIAPGIQGTVPLPRGFAADDRRISDDSDNGLPMEGEARQLLDAQIRHEEDLGGKEEDIEIKRAAEQNPSVPGPHFTNSVAAERPNEQNTGAALRESPGAEILEEDMETNASERRRLRQEKLSQRLMEVFGFEEREEVLAEMRCWLLRSVSK